VKPGLLCIEKFLLAWVPEVASVTINLCQLTHSLMVLCNVLVLLKLIVFCTVCSTTLQTVFCKLYSMLQDKLYLCSTTVQTAFTLQYCTTNCIHSAVIHYKLYPVNSAVLQYKLFTLQYYSTNCIHSTILQYKLY